MGAEAAAYARAGVPLEVGLGGGAPGGLSARLAGRLRDGVGLEAAWRAERGPLPRALGAVLAGGVRAGDPGAALARVAAHAALVRDLRGELAAAAAAPLAVVGVAAGLAAWALPPAAVGLAGVLEQAGRPVPAAVAWAASAADWDLWRRAVPPVLAVAAVALAGKLLGWRLIGLVPGLRRVRREFRRATACHLLGLLTAAEVPLGEAVRLAAGALPGRDAGRLADAAGRLDRGDDRAEVFAPGGPAAGALMPLTAWALASAAPADLAPDAAGDRGRPRPAGAGGGVAGLGGATGRRDAGRRRARGGGVHRRRRAAGGGPVRGPAGPPHRRGGRGDRFPHARRHG